LKPERSISGDCDVSDVLFLNEDIESVVKWLEGIVVRGGWRPLLIWNLDFVWSGKSQGKAKN